MATKYKIVINLTIGVQALCGEKDKALLEDIKENLSEQKQRLCTCRDRLTLQRCQFSLRSRCGLNRMTESLMPGFARVSPICPSQE